MIKLCGVAVIAVTLTVMIKEMKRGIGTLVGIAALLTLFFAIMSKYGEAITGISELTRENGLGRYSTLMIKALGIGTAVKITSDICRDFGEGGIAGGIELAGKLEILLLALPFISELLSAITDIFT